MLCWVLGQYARSPVLQPSEDGCSLFRSVILQANYTHQLLGYMTITGHVGTVGVLLCFVFFKSPLTSSSVMYQLSLHSSVPWRSPRKSSLQEPGPASQTFLSSVLGLHRRRVNMPPNYRIATAVGNTVSHPCTKDFENPFIRFLKSFFVCS